MMRNLPSRKAGVGNILNRVNSKIKCLWVSSGNNSDAARELIMRWLGVGNSGR